jgi:hypothetical protein
MAVLGVLLDRTTVHSPVALANNPVNLAPAVRLKAGAPRVADARSLVPLRQPGRLKEACAVTGDLGEGVRAGLWDTAEIRSRPCTGAAS